MRFEPTGATPPSDTSFVEPRLTENARKVLEARYLKKDESGACIEQPRDLFKRVAKTVADVERLYGCGELERSSWEHRYYDLMVSGRFQPNSPTLMNAGREMGMLSACFVLPVKDSINEIFNSIKHTALIQKAGGGTGFAFDELRPTGDFIQSSGGTTSGPISFWRAFSEATNAIQQGAFRRGANMGMMYVHHPDILKFLHAKQDLSQFTNYNISVKITDTWMHEFREDPDSPQIVRNPRNGKAFVIPSNIEIWKYELKDLIEVNCVEALNPNSPETYFRTPAMIGSLPADLQGKVYTKRDIWNIIIKNAWQTGEPGVIYIDRINQHNPTPHVGRIEATNPCGEQPLLPYEACNLGSINLGAFVKNACTPQAEVDWDAMRESVALATRFLDNIIDANNYPLPEIERVCRANRKIGLGVMGFADALYRLNVAYNSDEGVKWGERFMKFLNDEAHNSSEKLAKDRGMFENWSGSIWQTRHNRMMRNAAVTTVAPTGTISIIANCSGGIEPMFSLAFVRNVLRGQKQGDKPLIEVNDTFRDVARQRGLLSDELLERIAREGTLAHIDELPEDIKRVFVCAHDIAPEWHVKMQAAFQKHCDSSISKTINFPKSATEEDVEAIYEKAFDFGCKGVTVYRDGCRDFQPMALKSDEKKEPAAKTDTQKETPLPPAVADNSILPRPIEPRDLPVIVSGLRIRQLTPFGNMHVKITVDPRENRELELFAQLGKGGDVANSDLEAICRMTSLWLRSGGSVKHVIKQLDGIGSSLQIPTRNGRIMSLGDGLAAALKKYVRVKERFGLKALLLGEVDPSELDNPSAPPPHRPSKMPVDRPLAAAPAATPPAPAAPVAPAEPRNGGNGGSGGAASAKRGIATATEKPKTASMTRVAGVVKEIGAMQTGTLEAKHAAGGNGDSKSASASAVAVLAPPLTAADRLAPIDSPASTLLETRSNTATTISAKVSVHDAAANYKLQCPECQRATLAFQEGCRKCLSCGWSAC